MPDEAKIKVWKSPTVLKVEEYFVKDLEKGHLVNLAWTSAVSGPKFEELKEVLVVTGTSENGKGAYAIALEPMYFSNEKRYCRTEAYPEVSRTEEEIHQFIAVCALPTNYELPLEIIKILPDAFSLKTHLKADLTLKIIDSDKAIDVLDDLHCLDIPFSDSLIDQKARLEERIRNAHEDFARIYTPIIKLENKK